MNAIQEASVDRQLVEALGAESASTRLRAALGAGTRPHSGYLEVLVQRCGVESDFFVRDMLTWALTRLPVVETVPRLRDELTSENARSRAQALHSLSKIGDPAGWTAGTWSLLHDPDLEVARTAWRTAVALVDSTEWSRLATELAREFGRGDREARLSLSRALVELGELIEPVLEESEASVDPVVRAHAAATRALLRDPEAGFDLAVDAARRVAALGPQQDNVC